MDIRGKTVVITGPTGGIGEQLAISLVGLGANIVLAGRNNTKLDLTYYKIKSAHRSAAVEISPCLDTSDLDSIRAWAAWWQASHRPIHILVNNAGAGHASKALTPSGVPLLCHINYLGPYVLTRLLENVLVHTAQTEGWCRVVHVSSLLHRMGTLGDDVAQDFLLGDFGHSYPNNKLGNCLYGYEMQRRLGRYGIQSCVVDPGSVYTGIWDPYHHLLKSLLSFIYAPPSEGVKALVTACTIPWNEPQYFPPAAIYKRKPRSYSVMSKAASLRSRVADTAVAAFTTATSSPIAMTSRGGRQRKGPPSPVATAPANAHQQHHHQQQEQHLKTSSKSQPPPERDLRYFAPEIFALPALTWYSVEGSHGPLGRWFMRRFALPVITPTGMLKQVVWLSTAAVVSVIDWPIKQLSGGWLLSKTKAALSSPLSYDAELAAQLWEASADVAGLPSTVNFD